MALMDEFKEQREAMKQKSFRERLDYFWYYYKTTTIITVCVAVFAIIMIVDVVTAKDTAFYVTFLNCFPTGRDTEFMDEFGELTDIDFDKYDIYLDTSLRLNLDEYSQASLNAAQKFLAMAATGEIDVVVSDRDLFSTYADNGNFMSVDNYLTEEQMERYKDYFYYFDAAVLDEEIDYDEIYNSDLAVPEDNAERRDPSQMKDPRAVGIFLEGSLNDKLTEIGYYGESQEIVLGFIANEESKIYCQQFVDWLLGEG